MRFFGLLLILSLLGCAAPATDVVLWNDFGARWQTLSQPLAELRMGASPGPDEGSVRVERGIRGGDPDGVDLDAGWTVVRSRGLRATYGATELRIGPDGRASARESIPLRDLVAANVYAGVLAGVDFDSDVEQAEDYPCCGYDPAGGWPVQGLGASVGTVEIVDDAVSFDVSAHFSPGSLEDPDLNAAVPFATTSATVRWALVTVTSGALITTPVELSAFYAVGGESDSPHEPIDEVDRSLTLSGAPGLPAGVPVLRAWDFTFNGTLGVTGRNLRELSVGFEAFDYEPATGEASVLVDAHASIESAVQEGDFEVDFTAEVGLLQIDEGASVTEGWLSESFEGPGTFDVVVPP